MTLIMKCSIVCRVVVVPHNYLRITCSVVQNHPWDPLTVSANYTRLAKEVGRSETVLSYGYCWTTTPVKRIQIMYLHIFVRTTVSFWDSHDICKLMSTIGVWNCVGQILGLKRIANNEISIHCNKSGHKTPLRNRATNIIIKSITSHKNSLTNNQVLELHLCIYPFLYLFLFTL